MSALRETGGGRGDWRGQPPDRGRDSAGGKPGGIDRVGLGMARRVGGGSHRRVAGGGRLDERERVEPSD
jgi:hypothetical protein